MFGYVIRHLFSFRDNYFGEFTESRTFNEQKDRSIKGDDIVGKSKVAKKDLYQVVLSVDVTDSLLVMPDSAFTVSSLL